MYLGVVFIDQGTESATVNDFFKILPYTATLHVLAMLAGLLIATILKLRIRDRYTISIEVGLQNSALAIFVAATLLQDHSMALVAVVYGSFTFFSTWLFGWLVKRFSRPDASGTGR